MRPRMRMRILALGFALRLRSSPKAWFFDILVVCPVLLVGGNANNGANAGFVYSNANNAPSNANANIGSQLSFQNFSRAKTMPLGKKNK